MPHDDVQPKIGAGILGADRRQGWAEIRAAASFGSPIEQPTDYGMLGMATPAEAASPRHETDRPAERDSVLDERLKQVEASRDDHGRDDRGIERE